MVIPRQCMLKEYRNNNMVSCHGKNVFRSVTMDIFSSPNWIHWLPPTLKITSHAVGHVFGMGEIHEKKTIFLLRGPACQEQTIICNFLFICTIKILTLLTGNVTLLSTSASVTIYRRSASLVTSEHGDTLKDETIHTDHKWATVTN